MIFWAECDGSHRSTQLALRTNQLDSFISSARCDRSNYLRFPILLFIPHSFLLHLILSLTSYVRLIASVFFCVLLLPPNVCSLFILCYLFPLPNQLPSLDQRNYQSEFTHFDALNTSYKQPSFYPTLLNVSLDLSEINCRAVFRNI